MPQIFNFDRSTIKKLFASVAKSKLSMALLAVVALFLFSAESRAATVGICDPDAPGQCAASISLSGSILTITLTNTSPAANGGFITAAAFNLTAGTIVTNFTTTDANFVFTQGSFNVAPDGTRNALISATNNEYLGGGNPTGGVPAGGGTVTFTLTLATVNGNTEASIFNSMLIRERGFNDEGSDKDALVPTTNPVPEPTSMLLLGTGLIGIGAGIRRRRKIKK